MKLRAAAGIGVLAASLSLGGAPELRASDRWKSRLDRVENRLEAGDWKGALKGSVELRQKMVARLDDAAEVLPWAARTLVLQAIAEANLGRADDARWHWYSAQSYLDDLPELDLSGYGRAAELLSALSADDMPDEWVAPATAEDRGDRYREVEIREPVEPRYPRSLRRSAMEGKVSLEIVVDASGRARRPRILDAGLVPTMAFPILDAVQRWRFVAARRGDEPVAVLYRVRIDYR